MKKIFMLLPLLFLLSGCVQLEPPTANYRDVRISDVTTQGVKLNFVFDVQNKNPIAIDVSNYTYKVEINGKELLNNSGGGLTVEANASKALTIPVTVRWDSVINSVLGVVQSILAGNLYLDYKITGSITAGALGFNATAPLSASGRIPIPKEMLKL